MEKIALQLLNNDIFKTKTTEQQFIEQNCKILDYV